MARNLKSNGPGHNSGGMIDGEALKEYVERAARLMTEQKALGDDLKEVCKECDEAGACSKKELRRLARESLMDQEVLESQLERMSDLRHALGAFAKEPLGAAAIKEAQKPRHARKNATNEALDKARAHLEGHDAESSGIE